MTNHIKNREGFDALVARLEALDNSETSTLGFDMDKGYAARHHSDHPCGTACCIGGHADAMLKEGGVDHYMGVSTALAILAGIRDRASKDICFPPDNHPGWKAEPRHAVALLKHYDETGLVDWDKAMRVSA